MADQPGNGDIYLASDGRWYRWPDPTPYGSREAAEARDAWAVLVLPVPASEPGPSGPYGAPAQRGTGVARATAYLAALFVGAPILGAVVAWLVLPHRVEHGCEGLGFGCTLSPADSAFFYLFFVLLVTVPGVALAALTMRGLVSVWPWYRDVKALAKAAILLVILATPLVLIRVVGLIYYALIDELAPTAF